jgi:hypothetical protein
MARLGKFEGNADQDLAEYLHKLSLDGCNDRELGDVQDFGWYGLLLHIAGKGRMKSYIVHNDNYGFFDYTEYNNKDSALEAWTKLESEYEKFYGDADAECTCFSEENMNSPEDKPIVCPVHGIIL